ncbi:MAG: 2-C-methyl-D-erythritol 4-phosphate cytidylyltransferase [Idiomarina sp.]|nr:MAG: 2-C-methyl-D-erythritol 4-phosphate cytidylyltransferase [Idiomarina sp.]
MMHNQLKVAAVIPAAGIGSRMGLAEPKQYLRIADKTVLEHSVAAVAADNRVAAIYIAVAADDIRVQSIHFKTNCPVHLVVGGATRAASVFAGVAAAQADGFHWVVVHDAARPCLQLSELKAVIDAGIEHGDGAILALPVADTIKQTQVAKADIIANSIPREGLWRALTPQVFRAQQLIEALRQLGVEHAAITDEASAIELTGGHPKLVVGQQTNIKITQPGDERLAAMFIALMAKEQACE